MQDFDVCGGKKGLVLSAAVLYGYRGYNISLAPSFCVFRLVLAQYFGTVVGLANNRGGGEHSEEWQKAGSPAMKQNFFYDFVARWSTW